MEFDLKEVVEFSNICRVFLNDFKNELEDLYPLYITKIEMSSIGQKTTFDAYHIILSSTKKDDISEIDAINMSFTMQHIHTQPILCELSNIWDGEWNDKYNGKMDSMLHETLDLDKNIIWSDTAKKYLKNSFLPLKENFIECLNSWELFDKL